MDGWMDDMWTRNTLFGCILVLYVITAIIECTHRDYRMYSPWLAYVLTIHPHVIYLPSNHRASHLLTYIHTW
jgi:hypothetical protein